MNIPEWLEHINKLDAYYSEAPRPYNAKFHSSDELDEIRLVLEDWEADRAQLVERIISLTAENNNLFNETIVLSNHD